LKILDNLKIGLPLKDIHFHISSLQEHIQERETIMIAEILAAAA